MAMWPVVEGEHGTAWEAGQSNEAQLEVGHSSFLVCILDHVHSNEGFDNRTTTLELEGISNDMVGCCDDVEKLEVTLYVADRRVHGDGEADQEKQDSHDGVDSD